MKNFIPFHQIENEKVIVVDGLHPHNLVLSHWKGANKIAEVAADTSGEIVLNALERSIDGINCPNISATHFDIDGFVGVFALFFPSKALQYKKMLTAMARIGDFREFNPNSKTDVHALKLCCWMNKLEKEKFYRPFEEKDEIEKCVEKFDYFLPIFEAVLENPENYKSDWEEEFEQVTKDLEKITKVESLSNIGLVIKKASSPIHYYALFSETDGFDIVLSSYNEQRYELEFKYTTWIDLASRANLPRINLKPLVEKLNKMEESELVWVADKITDTGPLLRLEKDKLSKADRYANPNEREIFSSSIAEVLFQKTIIDFLKESYHAIQAKRFWTWEEMKNLKSLI